VEGCIGSLSINNEEVDLNINENNSGIIACDDILLDEVATFTGNNSYARLFDSFSPIRDFQLILSFRSSVKSRIDCNGLLVYIGSTNFTDHLTLNLDSGRVSLKSNHIISWYSYVLQMLLIFNNGNGAIAVEYNRLGVDFCDGNWYQVEVVKSGVTGRLIINGSDIEMSSSAFSRFTSVDSSEPLFIGGIPSKYTMAVSHKCSTMFCQALLLQLTVCPLHHSVAA